MRLYKSLTNKQKKRHNNPHPPPPQYLFVSFCRIICGLNKTWEENFSLERKKSKLSKCESSTWWLTESCQMKYIWMFTCAKDENISCYGDGIVSHSRGKWRMPIYYCVWSTDWLSDDVRASPFNLTFSPCLCLSGCLSTNWWLFFLLSFVSFILWMKSPRH